MTSRLTYSDALEFLYGLRLFGAKLGLENPRRLAAQAGNPQDALRFIHVAGTNGKGSTCAMLESIYRAAGLKVGLFTSPHLISFRERIQVDRRLIGSGDVIRLVKEAQGWLSGFPSSTHPTFFEVVAVMALRYFAEQGCDLVVWETGLGGRLDATNIVHPLVSIITNVQFDHEKWLGHSIREIAGEKAGIIKPGVPVVTAADHPEALEVIRAVAASQGGGLTEVTPAQTQRPPLDQIDLPLLGEHQRTNAALALAVCRVLADRIPVSALQQRMGLEQVHWSGRLQLHRTSEGQTVLLDGAHNPAGAESLRRALGSHFPDRRPTLILGVFRDKDWGAICRILAPLAARILLVPVQSERSASPDELERACGDSDFRGEVRRCESLAEAFEAARPDSFLLVTGSLHLVGEALELLRILPASGNEQTLNEWDSARPGPPGGTRNAP